MNMLLMGLLVSVFAMAVVAVAFRAATRPEPSLPTGRAEVQLVKAAAPAPLRGARNSAARSGAAAGSH